MAGGRQALGRHVGRGRDRKDVRLIDSVHACVLAESGEGKSRRVAILSALANFEQGRSLIINDSRASSGPSLSLCSRRRALTASST